MINQELQEKLGEMSDDELSRIYRNLFESPEGRLVLEDLRNRCYCYSTTALGDNIELNEGMRSVVLHIETQINKRGEYE